MLKLRHKHRAATPKERRTIARQGRTPVERATVQGAAVDPLAVLWHTLQSPREELPSLYPRESPPIGSALAPQNKVKTTKRGPKENRRTRIGLAYIGWDGRWHVHIKSNDNYGCNPLVDNPPTFATRDEAERWIRENQLSAVIVGPENRHPSEIEAIAHQKENPPEINHRHLRFNGHQWA
jgi:hypothetical protein